MPAEGWCFRHRHSAVLDYNADGFADLLEHWRGADTYLGGGTYLDHNQNLALSFNRASIEQAATAPDVNLVDLELSDGHKTGFLKAADVDGDSNLDLFGSRFGVFYGSGAKNRMLSRVVDGLGNVTRVRYDEFGTYQRNQTDASLPSCQGSWPDTCLSRMTGLVSSHEEGVLDGAEVQVRKTYKYRYVNARTNITGHGLIGFDRRVVAESTSQEPGQDPDTLSQPHGRVVTIDAEPILRTRL